MLRVANPKKLLDQESVATISGRTDVGARVEVNDMAAPVDPEGRFSIRIPLHPGKNPVAVVSTTAWGNAEKQLPPIMVARVNQEPNTATVDSAEVRWGKRKSKKKQGKPAKKPRQ
jgi:hypothetical protein